MNLNLRLILLTGCMLATTACDADRSGETSEPSVTGDAVTAEQIEGTATGTAGTQTREAMEAAGSGALESAEKLADETLEEAEEKARQKADEMAEDAEQAAGDALKGTSIPR